MAIFVLVYFSQRTKKSKLAKTVGNIYTPRITKKAPDGYSKQNEFKYCFKPGTADAIVYLNI